MEPPHSLEVTDDFKRRYDMFKKLVTVFCLAATVSLGRSTVSGCLIHIPVSWCPTPVPVSTYLSPTTIPTTGATATSTPRLAST